MKRKYIIFSDTIRAYKALTAAKTATGPEKPGELAPAYVVKALPQKATSKPRKATSEAAAPVLLPAVVEKATPKKAARRKGSFYIKTFKGFISVAGWIFNIDGLEIGAHKTGRRWTITDIMSGLAIRDAARLDDIPETVERYAEALRKCHQGDKTKQIIKELAALYKAAV